MPTDVDLVALDRLLEAGANLVEVLPAAEYAEEHIPGAINLPLKTLDRASSAGLEPAAPVVVYCWDSL